MRKFNYLPLVAALILVFSAVFPGMLFASVNLIPAVLSPLAPQSLLVDVQRSGDRLIAVGERGHILLSDDNGASWQQVEAPTNQMITAISFVEGGKGWAVGHDSNVLVTVDNGSSWSLQYDGLAATRRQAERSKVELSAEIQRQEAVRAELKASKLGGEDLSKELRFVEYELEELKFSLENAEIVFENVVVDPLLDLWFKNALEGYAVGSFGRVLYTNDGGQHWQQGDGMIGNIDGMHLNAVIGRDDFILLVGESGSLFRSIDAGESWQTLESPYIGSFFGGLLTSTNELYVFGLKGNLYRSMNEGASWEKITTGVTESLFGAVELSDGSIQIVGAAGVRLIGGAGANSFQSVDSNNRITLVAVIETANRDILAVGQGGIRMLTATLLAPHPSVTSH